MKAVNLAPSEGRKRVPALSVSKPTLGLLAGLALALVAVVLYVSTANQVSARQSELTRLEANVSAWKAAANSYQQFVTAAQQRSTQLGAIRQLVDSRFPWEQLLGQISAAMPSTAALSTLQAGAAAGSPSSTPGTPTTPSIPGASTTPGASTAPGVSTTASASTTSTTSSASIPPSIQLTGCAASQPAVAETMVRLREITGVTDVQLSSSAYQQNSSSGSSQCPFPVQFQMSVTLGSSAGAASSTSAPAQGATAPSSPSAPSTSSPAASASASTQTVAAR